MRVEAYFGIPPAEGAGASSEAIINWWEYEYGGIIVATGNVAWIAIEGGAD